MNSSSAVINLKYRKPGTRPPVFVAGTFSCPPWEPQEMEWMTDDDGEYIFVKAYVVDSKTEVQFKFRVGYGNWWVLCEEYPTTTDGIGNVNNFIKPQADPCIQSPTQTPMKDLQESQVPGPVEGTLQATVQDQVQETVQDAVHSSARESAGNDSGFLDKFVFPLGSGMDTNHATGDGTSERVAEASSTLRGAKDGYSESVEKQFPEEPQEAQLATIAEQCGEAPAPAAVRAIEKPKIGQHDKSVSATHPESYKASDNEQEAEAPEAESVDTRSESSSGDTASTAVEAAELEVDSELRRRHSTKNGDTYASLPSLPDSGNEESQKNALSWVWGVIDWIRKLFGSFLSWVM